MSQQGNRDGSQDRLSTDPADNLLNSDRPADAELGARQTPVESPAAYARLSTWHRFVPLLQKELRETLRDRRTIATLFLMPLLVYPIVSLLLQNFLPRDVAGDRPIRFRIVVESSDGLEPFLQRMGLADRALQLEPLLLKSQYQTPKLEQLLEGAQELALKSEDPAATDPSENGSDLPAALQGTAMAPEQLGVLQHQWSSYEGMVPIREVVETGQVDLAIRFQDLPTSPNQKLRRDGLRGKAVELIYNKDNEYSRRAAQYVALRIERSNLLESQFTLTQMGMPPGLSLERTETAVASTAQTAINGFATFIPLILIMMTITGAVYPAIDLTAGERERGTLESLIAAPVSRIGVLFAKYIAVWVVAMLTATLNVASMLTTMWVFQLDKVFLGDGITIALVVQFLFLLGLYALFFSAVLLVLTSIARSFKEAQAYLIPLMVFSLAPAILAMMPELGSGSWLAMVPMVNLVLLARDVMQSEVSVVFGTLAVVSTLLYSVAALAMAANLFGSDAVLYGSQGGWKELFRSEGRRRVPSPAFALLVLAILFPSQFVILGVMGRYRENWNPLQTLSAISLATIGLFLLLPAVLVALRRYDFRETFALRWPGFGRITGGVLLGIGVWPFVGLALWGLGNAYQWMAGQSAGSDWTQRMTEMAVAQVQGWSQVPMPILVLALAVLPAVCEEFFFRGLLLQALARRTSFLKAIVFSGLAFGLFHFVVESSVAPLRLVVTSTMGMLLAWVCLKSNSLLPGVLMHSINNGILTTVALLRQQLGQQEAVQNPQWITLVAVVLVALGLALAGGRLVRGRKVSSQVGLATVMLVLACGWVTTSQAQTVGSNSGVSQEDLPQVAEGWTVRRFADDELAHDIHSLGIGPKGEVFVAGPGYVAQLMDQDQDGIADQKRLLPLQPKQGPQGLWVEDDRVWVVADRRIWSVPRAAGQIQSLLTLPRTGGEHDFHAIRRGADGYLYFVAGNYAGIDDSFVNYRAPIARPQHGVVGRISPDGKVRQVLVDGMRNSYDFGFDLDHSLLVYDSDDERDSGLPWYRPTTLFDAKEGQTIGWVSRCYKQPDGVIGSSTIRSETGRGSPTGVDCLHRTDWGWTWVGATAFADWTFGRIYLQAHPALVADAKPLMLVSSRNGVAFAPTDLAFDGQGRLYVSVGGRDTGGAVYVIEKTQPEKLAGLQQEAGLEAILHGDQGRIGPEQAATLIQWMQQHPGVTASVASQLLRRSVRMAALNPEVSDLEIQSWQRLLETHQELLGTDWQADLALWLAINPPATKLPLAFADDTPIKRRSEMMACMSEKQLMALLQDGSSRDTQKQSLAALALRRSPEPPARLAVDLFSDDLANRIAGDPVSYQWDDWLVILRWAMGAPVPNDGNTSPWDFMNRSRALDRTQIQSLWPLMDQVWQKEIQDPEASRAAMLSYMKLELLLQMPASGMIGQWQEWEQKFGIEQGPIDQLEGLVVLAAVREPHTQWVRARVCDFLLTLDQQLQEHHVSTDNNWSDRFSAIGSLLLSDPQTLQAFRQSDQWNRPGQIDALKLLNVQQQWLPLTRMAETWEQWPAEDIPSSFMENLAASLPTRPPATGSVEDRQLWQKLAGPAAELQQRVQEQRSQHLALLKQKLSQPATNPREIAQIVQDVPWSTGDLARGKQLYETLNCLRCHAKSGRLGPSLAGVTRRFSRKDLVQAIVDPSSNVNDRYRALLVSTVDGKVLSGIPVYNSTDGMILEDSEGKTWQLSGDDIEQSRSSDQSLMPEGLMNQATDQDWADLYRYLESLQ